MQERSVYDTCYGEYNGRTVKGFIRYVNAKIEEKQYDFKYRCYVTDTLKVLVERCGGECKMRWCDVVNPDLSNTTGQETTPGESVDEAINNILDRCGVTIADKEVGNNERV